MALGGDVTQVPLGPDVHWEHSKALCVSEIYIFFDDVSRFGA